MVVLTDGCCHSFSLLLPRPVALLVDHLDRLAPYQSTPTTLVMPSGVIQTFFLQIDMF